MIDDGNSRVIVIFRAPRCQRSKVGGTIPFDRCGPGGACPPLCELGYECTVSFVSVPFFGWPSRGEYAL